MQRDVHVPAARTQSQLLPLLPDSTVFYLAIPPSMFATLLKGSPNPFARQTPRGREKAVWPPSRFGAIPRFLTRWKMDCRHWLEPDLCDQCRLHLVHHICLVDGNIDAGEPASGCNLVFR